MIAELRLILHLSYNFILLNEMKFCFDDENSHIQISKQELASNAMLSRQLYSSWKFGVPFNMVRMPKNPCPYQHGIWLHLIYYNEEYNSWSNKKLLFLFKMGAYVHSYMYTCLDISIYIYCELKTNMVLERYKSM